MQGDAFTDQDDQHKSAEQRQAALPVGWAEGRSPLAFVAQTLASGLIRAVSAFYLSINPDAEARD